MTSLVKTNNFNSRFLSIIFILLIFFPFSFNSYSCTSKSGSSILVGDKLIRFPGGVMNEVYRAGQIQSKKNMVQVLERYNCDEVEVKGVNPRKTTKTNCDWLETNNKSISAKGGWINCSTIDM